MTGTHDATAAEQRRLAAVPSIAIVVAGHVDDLAELQADAVPQPLRRLGAPPGWRLARLDGSPIEQARVAVCGQRTDGSFDGCETIRAFRFTGALAADVIRDNAACTLRGLGAQNITAGALAAPPAPAAVAVRSSGYFTAAGRRFWAQFSTYVANSTPPAAGLLIEHSLLIDADCRAGLSDDITHLSDAIHHAFLSAVDTGFHQSSDDTTGLGDTRQHLLTDMPTDGAGDPQDRKQ